MSGAIEYHKFPRGENCTSEGCRSRRYYVLDGARFCKTNGHKQEGYTQIAADEDDFNTQGRKTRKKREEKERVEVIFSGREATELFLQCWQLILWKQVEWLVRVKGMPEELETVVRDLWSVRLRAVTGLGDDETSSASDRAVGFSSTSEAETESDGMITASELGRRKRKRGRIRAKGVPKLIDTLGLCYLGMLLMRLPVSLGDFQRWTEKEEIIFLRANREVPKEMRARLPAFYLVALDSRSSLKRDDLHKAVLELIISFKQQLDLKFPPLNAPLLSFKFVRDLGLPLDIYTGARRLAKVLELDFSYPEINTRHRVTSWPEVQVISVIIIATKLSQPFDGVVRIAQSMADPSALSINWTTWLKTFSEAAPEGFRRGEEVEVEESDVFKMNGKKLDDYLNWYQRVWIDDTDSKMPQQLLDLFPLQDLPPEKAENDSASESYHHRVKQVQSTLTWHKPIPAREDRRDDLTRPGTLYKHYRKIDDLPAMAKSFYEKSAEVIGISLETLVHGVFLMEVKLESLIAEEKRRRMAEEYGYFDQPEEDT